MFWMNMIDAMYQSLVCFFIPYFVSVWFKPFYFKHFEENWQDTWAKFCLISFRLTMIQRWTSSPGELPSPQ